MSAYGNFLHPAVHTHPVSKRTPWQVFCLLLKPAAYLFSKIFICWHRKVSRPFTRDGETYRVCLRCGMRRHFDLQAWQTRGGYYCENHTPLRTSAPTHSDDNLRRLWQVV